MIYVLIAFNNMPDSNVSKIIAMSYDLDKIKVIKAEKEEIERHKATLLKVWEKGYCLSAQRWSAVGFVDNKRDEVEKAAFEEVLKNNNLPPDTFGEYFAPPEDELKYCIEEHELL